jgi:transposase
LNLLAQEQLESEITTLKARVQELEALNKWYMEQLKVLRQKQFGASSEKSNRDDLAQLNLFNEAEAERQPIAIEPDVETVSYQRKKR